VRRIAGPVAGRCEDLANEEPIGRKTRRDDVDDLPRGIAAAADFKAAALGRNHAGSESRGPSPHRGRAPVRQFGWLVGLDSKGGAGREIDSVGITGKYACARAQCLDAIAEDHATLSGEQHQAAFRCSRPARPWLADRDLPHREMHESPARLRAGDFDRGARTIPRDRRRLVQHSSRQPARYYHRQ